MEKDFTLFKVGWFTRVSGDASPVEHIHAIYRALLCYLQEHQLVVRPVLKTNEPLTDESKLMRSDLTNKGFQLYQQVEQRWLKGIDLGRDPANMRLFDKVLAKLDLEDNKCE